MPYRIGVDIGGTFTDFVLVNDETGEVALHKQLTTPRNPEVSVVEGCGILLGNRGLDFDAVESLVHGTTLVTNALIERRGSATGMLVTRGFSDILDIALERRYDLFDLRLRFPQPLVPRAARAEVDERIGYDGEVREPLDESSIVSSVASLIDRFDIKALAICFLHSFRNAAHEQRAAEIVREAFPDLYVSVSAQVFPHIREYERWTTATINAYTQPLVDRYLRNLEDSLRGRGFVGSLSVMASNGGTMSPEVARLYPVRMLESGPAAGALMSAVHGRRLGLAGVLSFDMGGTTAKGCLIRNGEPLKKYSFEVDRVHHFQAGSGLPVRIPVIDMIEIGAGGGGIAEVDSRGVIRVGPRSAGADPGPASYGKGTEPALTDADLILGYLDPAFFLGGRMSLDKGAAEKAIGDKLAGPLDIELVRAAWGIHEVINEDVARAFRVHASERGFDYRHCAMTAFGGAGPLHALRIARKLKIPKVIFPVGAGVMSAFGLLASPQSFEVVKSEIVRLSDLDRASFSSRFQQLSAEASEMIASAKSSASEITYLCGLDMRYAGQGYELEVALPAGAPEDSFDRLGELFADVYRRIFSMTFLEQEIEIVNWKLEARGPEPKLTESFSLEGGAGSQAALKGKRQAYFPELDGYTDCAVYNRYALKPGDRIEGPAFVEENESTCVIGVGERVEVDAFYNLVAEVATAEVVQ